MADQIQVHSSPTKPQIEAAIRQFFLAIGPVIGILAATGWGQKLHINEAVTGLLGVAGPVAAVVAFVWGQIATRKHVKDAAVMVPLVDDKVAVFK